MELTKIKISLEFMVKTSPSLLYTRLSTPSGLAEWFADDVKIKNGKYTFLWEGSEQTALLVSKKKNEFVRFIWEEEEEDENYFEFQILVDELTGDLALQVIDHVDFDEEEETTELWDTQVAKLRHVIGA